MKWIGNTILCDKNAKYWKENETKRLFYVLYFRDFLRCRHLISVKTCIHYQGTVVPKFLSSRVELPFNANHATINLLPWLPNLIK